MTSLTEKARPWLPLEIAGHVGMGARRCASPEGQAV